MSFVSLLNKTDQFQLMHASFNGHSYLFVMAGKESWRLHKNYEATGKIDLSQATVLWKGEGKIPEVLIEAFNSTAN